MKDRTICAVVVNDFGDILPYTTQQSVSQCEEYCKENFPKWERMKELGCVICQAEIVLVDTALNPIPESVKAKEEGIKIMLNSSAGSICPSTLLHVVDNKEKNNE